MSRSHFLLRCHISTLLGALLNEYKTGNGHLRTENCQTTLSDFLFSSDGSMILNTKL